MIVLAGWSKKSIEDYDGNERIAESERQAYARVSQAVTAVEGTTVTGCHFYLHFRRGQRIHRRRQENTRHN